MRAVLADFYNKFCVIFDFLRVLICSRGFPVGLDLGWVSVGLRQRGWGRENRFGDDRGGDDLTYTN